MNLIEIARICISNTSFKACGENSDIHSNKNPTNQWEVIVGTKFLQTSCPEFLNSSLSGDEDRFVKVGRKVLALTLNSNYEEKKLENSLRLIIDQHKMLLEDWKIPKVRFGKTNIDMPIVTLGCMRFQQTWNDTVNNIDQVIANCQENLIAILRRAITLGVNHIETARGYGCSDLQIGSALRLLFSEGFVKREDMIIQTKVNPMEPEKFRASLDLTIDNLGVDYIDLGTIHGLNLESLVDELFGDTINLIDILKEYQEKGKIRYIGFSTHGRTDLICRMIKTGVFDYVNLHYHFCGSYTSSGEGDNGAGNYEAIKLAKEYGMGVFIISPYDKGGRVYAPSHKLSLLTYPDFEPITYASLWLWNHKTDIAPIHTITAGVARPSDLDELIYAAYLHTTQSTDVLEKIHNIEQRLVKAHVDTMGNRWFHNWHVGLMNCATVHDKYQFLNIVWLHNIILAWGLWDYAKERYSTFVHNRKELDFNLSTKANIVKRKIDWGYVPGISIDPLEEYQEYMEKVPERNKILIKKSLNFVHKYCSENSVNEDVPDEWKTLYDLRPWIEFPEQHV